MGDRYIFEMDCPKCKYHDDEVYYAPTCGFVDWTCPECGTFVDLEKYTGISYADCSNADEISKLLDDMKSKFEGE